MRIFYSCKLENKAEGKLSITEDNVSVTSVSGNHANGKSNNDVEVLYISGQTIFFLPKNIVQFFPNLKGIVIFSSHMKTLRKQDIAPFTKLLFFFIAANEIKEIDGDLFESNPGVEYFSFTSNPLMHIGPDLFHPLQNLKEVHCSKCKCYDILNATPTDDLKLALSVNCPPTLAMIEKAIFSGKSFNAKFEEKVVEKTEFLAAEIETIKKENYQLKYKIAEQNLRMQKIERQLQIISEI